MFEEIGALKQKRHLRFRGSEIVIDTMYLAKIGITEIGKTLAEHIRKAVAQVTREAAVRTAA